MFQRLPHRRPLFESLEPRQHWSASDFGTAGNLIRFPEAAGAYPSATGLGQTIAVIDSGIDYTQGEFGGAFGPGHKVVGGYDFVDNDANPMDTFGHGTKVAGILASSRYTISGLPYQGIAPDAKLVALRIDGDGTSAVPDSRIELALKWVIAHRTDAAFGPNGITVVNISYGQGTYNGPTVSNIYGDELQTLHDLGVFVVTAAGNNDNDTGAIANGINSPAADPNVISVGSVDQNDTISDFSLRGPPLDLFAPGDNLITPFASVDGGGFGIVSGTSFASPIVAGTVALMRETDPSLKPDDALSILRASGIPNFDGDTETGTTTRVIYPRLDMLNALNMTVAREAGTPTEQANIGQFGNQNTMAVDAQGVTHLVYYDVTQRTMLYATQDTAGEWSKTQVIDNSMPLQGLYLSMAVDGNGQPAVAYFDGTNGDLKYASYDGSSWHVASIDIKNSTGAYPSLVFDRNGLPLISYYRKTSGDLRVARRDFYGNWTIAAVATDGDVGRSTAAAVDAKGNIGIAYEDSTHGWVDYAQFNAKAKIWSTTVVDKATRGASYISMAFSTADQSQWISYYDSNPANLKVAHFTSRKWHTTTVVARGAVGLFTNLFFADADQANVLYYDKRQNGLFLAELENGSWDAERLQSNAGRFAVATPDRTDAVLRYTYYTNGNLKIGSQPL